MVSIDRPFPLLKIALAIYRNPIILLLVFIIIEPLAFTFLQKNLLFAISNGDCLADTDTYIV